MRRAGGWSMRKLQRGKSRLSTVVDCCVLKCRNSIVKFSRQPKSSTSRSHFSDRLRGSYASLIRNLAQEDESFLRGNGNSSPSFQRLVFTTKLPVNSPVVATGPEDPICSFKYRAAAFSGITPSILEAPVPIPPIRPGVLVLPLLPLIACPVEHTTNRWLQIDTTREVLDLTVQLSP
eukprot:1187965-Prorocentrum_minimum.AAC.2